MKPAAYEHHGRPVAREAFYAIACDPARSVAVEACAGAGKTWMLVSRMLRALLEGAQPHEILAITFTKKAAGEMRQRLQEWLAEFAHAAPEQLERELLARGIGAERAHEQREALKNLYRSVLAAGRPVQIRTFHSWFAALLRSAPVAVLQQLGLPLNYELLEDDSRAVAGVWRRFYAALLDDAAARADYQAVVARHGRFQAGKALEAALSKRVEFALADENGVVDRSVRSFGEQFPEFAECEAPQQALFAGAGRAALLAAAQALGRASAPTFSAKGGQLERAVSEGRADAVFDALLTQKQEPRKFGDKLAGIEAVRAAQAFVQRVQAAQEQHAAWQYQQELARLARVLLAEFAALKRERGWVDMNDVERAALVLLSDPVLSGWVQQRLDASVRHLLIDEFQDTNPLQWQALHAWLASYAGAGGRAPSVFIVGDPKQSIYRFRRAEPQVFLAAQAFVVEGLGGDLLSCDHTRRNAPEVIEAVNEVMLQAQQAGDYQGFRTHSTESREPGAVLQLPPIARGAIERAPLQEGGDPLAWRDSLATPRSLPEESLRQLECRQAARWIAGELQAGLRPRDVMVLARKRDRLSALQDELRTLHIPSQQPEKAELGAAPEVQDVVALLDALVSPAHDLSLARALKSPLFGCSDEVLAALALARRASQATDEPLSWFELLQSPEPPAGFPSAPGPALLRWKGWLDSLPPHDALQAIYQDGDVLARFAAAAPAALREATLANLRALLGAALQIDGGRYATPYALVRALRGSGIKAPASAELQAVRLLTVHGAKGLEAPLVLLLDTDAPPARAETMGVLVDWPGEALQPRRFVFLASETRPSACAVELLAAEQAARRREELNALYVAMTRARGRLAFSSIEPHRASEGSWRERLAPQAEMLAVPEGAALPAAAAEAPIALAVLPVLPSVPPAGAPPPPEAAPDSLATRMGRAMHRLLERTPLGAAAVEAALVAAAAREFALGAGEARHAAAMAERILAGAGAWAWDARLLAWHGNEVTLLHRGRTLRLDRLVQRRDDGHWWVLDYKSAAQPLLKEDLVAQMHGYRAALRAAHPQAVVRAAFLTAQGGLVEVPEDEEPAPGAEGTPA